MQLLVSTNQPLNIIRWGICSLMLVLSWASHAQSVEVSDAWARALPPVAKVGAAYLTLTNRSGTTVTISKVSSSIAKEAQVHDHIMEDGVMKMTQLTDLSLDAGESVEMKPHGKHLMLFGLKEPLKDGGTFSVRIEFKEIDPVEFEVPIKKQ
ncbi:MAG: copper chaperone PCu(A)C [Gammaproteobacteria bacterium]